MSNHRSINSIAVLQLDINIVSEVNASRGL